MHEQASWEKRLRRWGLGALLAAALVAAGATSALAEPFIAPVIPAVPIVPTGFDITGFIQEATLDQTGAICKPAHPRLAGGTVTVNGQKVVIPCNTVLQMPAFTLSWADLFQTGNAGVPRDIVPANQTGLALKDLIGTVTGATIPGSQAGLLTATTPSGPYSASLPSYEIHLVGNVVNGQYIAGLVFISQQSLNAGQGVISCIDYNTGEMQVGGTPVDPSVAPYTCPSPVPPGVTRVRLNDTIGRYGKSHAPIGGCGGKPDCVEEAGFDPRFTPDTDNPTIHSASGYPMCIPRVNPFISGQVDPECPQSNRPIAPNCKSFDPALGLAPFPNASMGYCMTFVMDMPKAPTPAGVSGTCPGPDPLCPTDPTKQAPLQIGDNIVFNGTLKSDAAGTYISAHTVNANLGIYTQPNTQPAYTFVEEVLAGTDARPVAGLSQEATGRVKFVGFTTDIWNPVDLFALDQDPMTGTVTERLLGTQTAVSSPLLGRFRTPANNNGAFLPPTRNYRAVSRTMCNGNGPCMPEMRSSDTYANGLLAGQYLLPNFEFIFAENLVFGQPLVPNNLQDLPFLFCGSGPLDGPGSNSPVVGQLDPAPWAAPMDDPIFHSTLCPTAKAVDAARIPPTPSGNPDVLTLGAARWDNKAGKGKINLIVTSSASPAPAGMFMNATIVNENLAAGIPGSTANPIVIGMVLTGNTPAAPAVCPTTAPCWQLLAPGLIVDPNGNGPGLPSLVPPTAITVRSSLGGTATTNAITVLNCVPTKRLTCQ